MRAIMIAMLTSATLGLAGTSTTQAAPVNGGVIVGAATTGESLVQLSAWRRCVHYRYSRRVCRWHS